VRGFEYPQKQKVTLTKKFDIEELKKMINSALNQTQVAVKASG